MIFMLDSDAADTERSDAVASENWGPPPLRRQNTAPAALICEHAVMAQIMLEDSLWLDRHRSDELALKSASRFARIEERGENSGPGQDRAHISAERRSVHMRWHSTTVDEDGGSQRGDETECCVPVCPLHTVHGRSADDIDEFMDEDGRPSAAQKTMGLLKTALAASGSTQGLPHVKQLSRGYSCPRLGAGNSCPRLGAGKCFSAFKC